MVKTGSKTATAKRRARTAKSQRAAAVTPVVNTSPRAAAPAAASPRTKLLPGRRILQRALTVLWTNRGLFLGIMAVYAVLSLLLIQSLTDSLNVGSLHSLLSQSKSAGDSSFITARWLLGDSSSSEHPTSGIFQFLLFLVASLALVWALRQVSNNARPRIRDAFYRGMYPVIPVLLVLLFGIVQLLPAALGLGIYGLVMTNGLAAQPILQIAWALPALGLTLWSLYLLSSTAIALYIAALPDMAPVAALKSAKKLVRYRRWVVLRRILFLTFFVLVVFAVILIPALFVTPLIAPWLLFALALLILPLVHAYLYSLYRELLK